ncbi:MAG: hypothetical protein ACP5E3_06135, partial [Bacteroidales bacterium]
MTKIILIIILIVSFSFSSCQKEDITSPADASLRFTMENNDPMGGNLTISEASFKVSELRFIGQRNVGEDIDFKRTFDSFVEFDLLNSPDNSIAFNVPIGLYEQFDLRINIVEGSGDFIRFDEEFSDWLEEIEDEREDNSDDDGDDNVDDNVDDDVDDDVDD